MGGEQPPEVSISRVVGQLAHQWQHLAFTPVVAGHDEETGGLSFRVVEILQIVGGGAGGLLPIVPVVSGIRTGELRQGTNAEPVFFTRLGNELPHPFGDAEASGRSADERVEVALLQGQVEELWGQLPGQQLARNAVNIMLLDGGVDGGGEPAGGFPLRDVGFDFANEAGRKFEFTLAEDACHADNQPFFRRQA